MNTLHFKYALEIEKTGSITQAADNLYMGQPSLSKVIRELEDSLHIEIFRRTPHGMVPTEEGARFLQYARNILIQLDNMEQISSSKDGNIASLHVSLPHSSYLFQGASAFSREIFSRQPLELGLYTLSEKEAVRLVGERALNFAVIRIPAALYPLYQDFCISRKLKQETIWSFREWAVLSDKKDFPPGKPLLMENLADFIRVRFRQQDMLFSSAAEMPNKAAVKAEKLLLLDSYSEALSYLSGNGDAYLTTEPLSREQLKTHGLFAFPLRDGREYRDLLLYPKGYRFREAERLFIDKLFEQKNLVAF